MDNLCAWSKCTPFLNLAGTDCYSDCNRGENKAATVASIMTLPTPKHWSCVVSNIRLENELRTMFHCIYRGHCINVNTIPHLSQRKVWYSSKVQATSCRKGYTRRDLTSTLDSTIPIYIVGIYPTGSRAWDIRIIIQHCFKVLVARTGKTRKYWQTLGHRQG